MTNSSLRVRIFTPYTKIFVGEEEMDTKFISPEKLAVNCEDRSKVEGRLIHADRRQRMASFWVWTIHI